LLDHSAETNLAIAAALDALFPGHPIDRLGAEIYQIASEVTERFKKLETLKGWQRGDESLVNCAIESRVGLVKESPGSRRRFANKEDSYFRRAVMLSQTFSGQRFKFGLT
jgi:hypothetical protein